MKKEVTAHNYAPVFDYQGLLDFWNHQNAVIERVLSAFIQAKGGYLSDMQHSLRSRNSVTIRAACHKLSGSASTVRALRVAEISEHIRTAAIAEDFESADQLLPQLQQALNDFLHEVGETFPNLKEKIDNEV